MPIPLSETITAPILFFLMFFIAFSLSEYLIIRILNRLEKRYWEFMVDDMMKTVARHGKTVRLVTSAVATVMVAMKAIAVLNGATDEIKIFTVILLVTMFVIYKMMTRDMARLHVEKLMHRYLYEILSFFVVVVIVALANHRYSEYKAFVNEEIVTPAASSLGLVMDEPKKQKLLKIFRAKIAAGQCPAMDYRDEKGGPFNFILITHETQTKNDGQSFVPRGHACADGSDTFLLADNGAWYWVSQP